jgi:ATP-binding protein involved in chromosome partitioning
MDENRTSQTAAAAPKEFPLPRKQQVDRVKHVIAISSAKGGVGKSTLAINLAFALQSLSYKVGLMDADIYGPSLPTMLGVRDEPKPGVMGRIKPVRAHGMPLMSIGFMTQEDQPLIWRGPMLYQVIQQFFHEVKWTNYGEWLDYLIIDLPPGTGDVQLSMAQQIVVSGAVIVTTPQDVALADVRRGLSMFQMVEIPVIGVVENMSYFLCPHCGERTDIFSSGGALRVSESKGVPMLGSIPLDPAIRAGGDMGKPIMMSHPESEHARTYVKIAQKIHAWVEKNAVNPFVHG